MAEHRIAAALRNQIVGTGNAPDEALGNELVRVLPQALVAQRPIDVEPRERPPREPHALQKKATARWGGHERRERVEASALMNEHSHKAVVGGKCPPVARL